MTDIDKIIWREVDYDEFAQTHYREPRRIMHIDGKAVRYEVGKKPTELPTKPGAVVAPVAPNSYGFPPYVLGPEGTWYELQRTRQSAFPVSKEDIIDGITWGTSYIAYGGYDE